MSVSKSTTTSFSSVTDHPPPPSCAEAILPDKYNYIDLFKDVLDLSSKETRANLLYIGDYQRNANERDYASIWTSLAVTLTEAAMEGDVYLPKPGIPLFRINDTHLTNNFWYEVTYRSLRLLDLTYGCIKSTYFNHNGDAPFPHKGIHVCNSDENMIQWLEDSFGCHRIIQYFMENTELQKMIEKDMGYTADDMTYDINRIHILYAFIHAYRLFNAEEYQLAARYFKQSLDLWNQTKLEKKDKLGLCFGDVCVRCIRVSLGYYHLSSPDAHTKYALAHTYFVYAKSYLGYQDPQGQIPKVQQMMKSSCLPQKQKDAASLSEEIENEINNLIKHEKEKELTLLTGSNPADKFPFRLLRG